jgi:hypothetical protein
MAGCVLMCIGWASSEAIGTYLRPTSYTATPGEGRAEGGTFDYFDHTGIQLTDGILGGKDLFSSFYEWVGWGIRQPQLRFWFAQSVQVNLVEIHVNRNDQAAIALPSRVVINGRTYWVSPQAIPNQSSGFLRFKGVFEGRPVSAR